VIPNKTAKKFPKYYLQPTLENAFQHSEIEEQVQHAHPKNISKKASLCTQTGKTHARRRSQLLSGTAETIERKSRPNHDARQNEKPDFNIQNLKQQLNGSN